MSKLKSKDVKEVRETLLELQGGVCAICGKPPVISHLDHCHKHGHIRAVLCSNHNMYLGKVENTAARYLISRDELPEILEKIAKYLRQHQTSQTGLIHPAHFTPEERKERAKKRAQRKKAKATK